MIPRALQRLLLGRGATVTKRRTPPIAVHFPAMLVDAAQRDPRVRHDLTQGEFRVVDESADARRGVVLQPVDPDAAAVALAEELQRLSADASSGAAAPDADPSPPAVPARFAAGRAAVRR